jgi:hypothetical protein
MKMLRKRILGPVTLLHLIVLSASIATVLGATMLYYDWVVELHEGTPDLTFLRWSDGTTAGRIVLSYTFYSAVTTYDDNATWGIWNQGASNKTAYLYATYPNKDDNIDYFQVDIVDEIIDPINPITTWATWDWSNIGESNAVSWTAIAGRKYTIRITARGADPPLDGFEPVTLKLKTDA